MKILNIGWLYCENCDDDGMVVKTEKGRGFMLYQGDKFVCPRCGGRGEIEIVNDNATAPKPSRIVLDETSNHDDIAFRRAAAELLFSDGGYTMNIAQLARMKDEKLVDSYTTA